MRQFKLKTFTEDEVVPRCQETVAKLLKPNGGAVA